MPAAEGFGAELAGEIGFEERATVNPAMVRFTQSSIRGSFSNGTTLESTIQALKGPEGEAVAAAIPPIRIFARGASLFTLDNRRLLAFSEAGVDIPYLRATMDQMAAESWKFTAGPEQMNGWFIRVKPP